MSKSYNHLKITNLQKQISSLLKQTIQNTLKVQNFEPEVKWSSIGKSDLSSSSAIRLFNSKLTRFGTTKELANEIVKNFPKNEYIKEMKITKQITKINKCDEISETTNFNNDSVDEKSNLSNNDKIESTSDDNDNYFIDFFISDEYLQSVSKCILNDKRIKLEIPEYKNKKILVDFSSPNIAKEMHVGHLRSTIIGDTISRILEYLECDVMRINHVGDWGTQFGMLITKLKEDYPNFLIETPNLSDLESFYIDAKKKFMDNNNLSFRQKAHKNTVLLQSGEEESIKAWKIICEASRLEFNEIYKRLDIKIYEQGESFYNDIIRKLIPDLEIKNFVEISDGAKVIRIDEMKNPVIVVKSDGGFNYSTTDLAALNYRLNNLNRNWIIYVIGKEQNDHIKSVFFAAKKVGIFNPEKSKLSHVSFGHILNKSGLKFSTSKGKTIKLKELLDESIKRAYNYAISGKKNKKFFLTENEISDNLEKIGYSSIKYYDLKQNRNKNYKFDYDLILDPKGNSAIYHFYNYVRINTLKNKSNLTSDDILKIANCSLLKINHKRERGLIISLLKFQEAIENTLIELKPNIFAEYLYEVSINFSKFFLECNILQSENRNNRLMILELTAIVMKQSFDLLGMTPINRM